VLGTLLPTIHSRESICGSTLMILTCWDALLSNIFQSDNSNILIRPSDMRLPNSRWNVKRFFNAQAHDWSRRAAVQL